MAKSKAVIKVTKTKTVTTTRSKARVKKGKVGNPNKCPVCGKFVGSKHG